jgi:hypothetical protein
LVHFECLCITGLWPIGMMVSGERAAFNQRLSGINIRTHLFDGTVFSSK